MEIIVCNYAFFENPESISHTVPLLVLEMRCALQVFLLFIELEYPTLDFDMGFLCALHICLHFQDCLLYVF